MGSPASAVIAKLVMQEIKTIALNNALSEIRWWRHYVDDSNACLKEHQVQTFHDNVNSINPNIKCTIELPKQSERGQNRG